MARRPPSIKLSATVIRPKVKPNIAALANQALIEEGNKIAREMKKEFSKTTRHWKHRVKFESGAKMSGAHTGAWRRSVIIYCGTKDPIYAFVDRGTKPHTIKAKQRWLVFMSTVGNVPLPQGGFGASLGGRVYRPHTTPGRITSRPRKYDGIRRRVKAVNHPGIEARGFSEAIRKKFLKGVEFRLGRALHSKLRQAGAV